jgi:hypothetical protein
MSDPIVNLTQDLNGDEKINEMGERKQRCRYGTFYLKSLIINVIYRIGLRAKLTHVLKPPFYLSEYCPKTKGVSSTHAL